MRKLLDQLTIWKTRESFPLNIILLWDLKDKCVCQAENKKGNSRQREECMQESSKVKVYSLFRKIQVQ